MEDKLKDPLEEAIGEVAVASLREDGSAADVQKFFAAIKALRTVGKSVAFKTLRSDYYLHLHLMSRKGA